MAVGDPQSSSPSGRLGPPQGHDKKRPPPQRPHTLEAATTNHSDTQSSQQSVRFSDVEIRPYRRLLGDHAGTDVPLGLGWDYAAPQRHSVDAFESAQHGKPETYQSANDYEPLTSIQRTERLRRAGYSHKRIRALERRRKIELVKEWAYRQNREELTPAPCANAHVYMQRYIV